MSDDFTIDAEADRFFDESSLPDGDDPVAVVIAGDICAGKSTLRRTEYASGYVVVDAAEIFLGLGGIDKPFPDDLAEPLDDIGLAVARRAILERRDIVTEIVGSDGETPEALSRALKKAGYRTELIVLACDVEECLRRNRRRGDDNVSAYYTEPYHRHWIVMAALEAAFKDAEEDD